MPSPPSASKPVAAKTAAKAAAPAVKLDTITSARIDQGGYKIKATGPSGAALYLCVGSADNRVDITGGYNASKMDALFRCLVSHNVWAQQIDCWAVADGGGESTKQKMLAPVQPFDGPLTFDGMKTAVPKLTYPGNGKGRTLTDLVADKYWFRNGSALETDNTMRGFDCTTFPMALFSVYPNMSEAYGTKLADALGAQKCDLEQLNWKQAQAQFQYPVALMGFYYVWSAGHVVLVCDAIMHQFNNGGYLECTAASWEGWKKAPQGLWWIRKLPDSRRMQAVGG